MRRGRLGATALAFLMLVMPGRLSTATGAQEITARAVMAANRYLELLDPDQRAKSAFEFTSPTKATWHNGPPNSNIRAGTTFGALTPAQRQAGYAVMEAVLSPYGHQKVLNIMDADEEFGRGGANFPTGPMAYSVAIYGTPSRTEPWQVQINGHHLGLNITVVGRENILAPSLTGALPSTFEKDGKTIRTLGEEADSAFALMAMLNASQRSKAILNYLNGDLVLGPGQDGRVIQPEGLKGSEMTAQQKAAMVRITAAWVNILDKRAADPKLAEIRKAIDDTYFAWGGETTAGARAYFRVQGPTVFIEYGPMVNAGRGGGAGRRGAGAGGRTDQPAAAGAPAAVPAPPPAAPPATSSVPPVPGQLDRNRDPNHIHTIFRDFTNDYGKKVIK